MENVQGDTAALDEEIDVRGVPKTRIAPCRTLDEMVLLPNLLWLAS